MSGNLTSHSEMASGDVDEDSDLELGSRRYNSGRDALLYRNNAARSLEWFPALRSMTTEPVIGRLPRELRFRNFPLGWLTPHLGGSTMIWPPVSIGEGPEEGRTVAQLDLPYE